MLIEPGEQFQGGLCIPLLRHLRRELDWKWNQHCRRMRALLVGWVTCCATAPRHIFLLGKKESVDEALHRHHGGKLLLAPGGILRLNDGRFGKAAFIL